MTLQTFLTVLKHRLPAPLRKLSPGRIWFLPPLFAGVLILILTVTLTPGAKRDSAPPAPLPVRVIELKSEDVTPTITAFGAVRPLHIWQAVAQVPGQISWRHPGLQPGATFNQGERLLTIDVRDYVVAVNRSTAQVAAANAALSETGNREQNLHISLDIEQEAFALQQSEYKRNQALVRDGHISAVALDAQRQALLRQQQSVQNLSSQLNLIPAQRSAAEARIAEAKAALSKSEQDLKRTEFVMPFTGRISRLNVEDGQFVPMGQSMLIAESIRILEVAVELPYDLLVSRFPAVMADPSIMANPGEALPAELSYQTQDHTLAWRGYVARVDTGLNPVNRSVAAYIHIQLADDEPAPAANLFVSVRISGPVLADRIVIPRLAYRSGKVLIADPDGTLSIRSITPEFREDEHIIIREGVSAGELLVITDVLFPENDMLIATTRVQETASL